jgi:hypothetical protein
MGTWPTTPPARRQRPRGPGASGGTGSHTRRAESAEVAPPALGSKSCSRSRPRSPIRCGAQVARDGVGTFGRVARPVRRRAAGAEGRAGTPGSARAARRAGEALREEIEHGEGDELELAVSGREPGSAERRRARRPCVPRRACPRHGPQPAGQGKGDENANPRDGPRRSRPPLARRSTALDSLPTWTHPSPSGTRRAPLLQRRRASGRGRTRGGVRPAPPAAPARRRGVARAPIHVLEAAAPRLWPGNAGSSDGGGAGVVSGSAVQSGSPSEDGRDSWPRRWPARMRPGPAIVSNRTQPSARRPCARPVSRPAPAPATCTRGADDVPRPRLEDPLPRAAGPAASPYFAIPKSRTL